MEVEYVTCDMIGCSRTTNNIMGVNTPYQVYKLYADACKGWKAIVIRDYTWDPDKKDIVFHLCPEHAKLIYDQVTSRPTAENKTNA